MTVRARGRFYEDGPYVCCDHADVHPQPCTCASAFSRIPVDALRLPIEEFYAQPGQEGDQQ